MVLHSVSLSNSNCFDCCCSNYSWLVHCIGPLGYLLLTRMELVLEILSSLIVLNNRFLNLNHFLISFAVFSILMIYCKHLWDHLLLRKHISCRLLDFLSPHLFLSVYLWHHLLVYLLGYSLKLFLFLTNEFCI